MACNLENPKSEWITPGTLLVMCFKGGITESEADLAHGDYRGWVFSSTVELQAREKEFHLCLFEIIYL